MGTVLRAMTICDTPKMEVRYDLKSILTLLPLVIRSSSTTTPLLFWPSQVVEALKSLSQGPIHSNVSSGDSLFIAISDIRNSLSLSSHHLNRFAHEGYSLFFDELISRADSTKWFGEVIPAVANLLLQLPALLEMHYQNADKLLDGDKCGVKAGLRLLGAQAPGIVLLSQELIGALLACAFFCLFPVTARGAKDLPMINFDYLFGSLYETYSETQENKIKCIIHYFERICSCMPKGFVSFERKVLPLEQVSSHIPYPKTDFWSTSSTPLCPVEVCSSGLIEDQSSEALEVDFANEYLGGGALHRGCVQEEIRFMINPELIVGMLFLPRMEDNEAIEIIGAERFSNYRGYASSFCFAGDHKDKRSLDIFGRRKTRIIAIDALCSPRMRQFKLNYLLRYLRFGFSILHFFLYSLGKLFLSSFFSPPYPHREALQLQLPLLKCVQWSYLVPSVEREYISFVLNIIQEVLDLNSRIFIAKIYGWEALCDYLFQVSSSGICYVLQWWKPELVNF